MQIRIVILLSFLTMIGCQKENKQEAKQSKQPNIVFIMTDDHALSAISAYEGFLSKVAPTPNIDRIANEGVRFNNMFCNNSICGPSRASILTGKFSHMNGFYKNEGGGDFDGSQQTFPKLLQKSGYETAVIGKWHLGTSPTGFDYSASFTGEGRYDDWFFLIDGVKTKTEGWIDDVSTDFAIDYINRDHKQPFVLAVGFKTPHIPFIPPARAKDRFAGEKIANTI